MTTTSSAMGEETQEQKAERIRAARAAGAAKAREARAAQAALKRETGDVTEENLQMPAHEAAVWREAFFIAMRNREAKSHADLAVCGALADQIVDFMVDRGVL